MAADVARKFYSIFARPINPGVDFAYPHEMVKLLMKCAMAVILERTYFYNGVSTGTPREAVPGYFLFGILGQMLMTPVLSGHVHPIMAKAVSENTVFEKYKTT